MTTKYRVHEVAKDFGLQSKDIIQVLAGYSDEPKKYMSVLTEEELNYVFESLTERASVKNFDQYFAMVKEKTAKKEKAEAIAKHDDKKPDTKQETKTTDNKTTEAKPQSNRQEKTAIKPTQNNNNKTTNANANHAGKPENAQKAPNPHRDQKKPVAKKHEVTTDVAGLKAEFNIKEPTQKEAVVVRNEKRTIDTRTPQVELEKYNQRFDDLAISHQKTKNENEVRKQKITQKSKQYNRKGRPQHKRETETERLKRIALERKKKQMTVLIPEEITVGELAKRLKATAAEIIKKLMVLGVMASINDVIDFDSASLVAMDMHAKVEKEIIVSTEEKVIDDTVDAEEDLKPRSPVVVVMGHVDHGKTSLLDAIRNTHVTAGEAGGITQAIGAYKVKVGNGDITFLDTPGHAAFTAMRARGAMITDIAILVVAADDGIMPQTVEAINHAKAAGVQIIVAINKMDKPGAKPERVMQQLTEYGLVAEEWGGDTICVPVSAVKHEGIDKLLEMVMLEAEMLELKANPNRLAKGAVVEAFLDKGRGPVATVLVQNGTLHSGDIVVAGTAIGRVRAMTNDQGKKIDEAGPTVPVEIVGLTEVPQAGDVFNAVTDEKLARQLVEERKTAEKEEKFKLAHKVNLDNLFEQMQAGDVKDLNIIVKADVQGSVEAVTQSLVKLTNEEVRVNVIHGGVGAISESDVMLATASNAIIVGFNVRPSVAAKANAEADNVEIRLYRIIYDCIEEIQSAMKGMLAPKFREVALGSLEVRTVYKISSVGTIAGAYVTDGKVTRNANIRVVRDGIVITEDKIDSLKRFKDDAKEVAQGYECGVGLEKYNDIKEGDIFEVYTMEEYRD